MKFMCHFNVIYFLHKTHNQTPFKECKKYFQTILYALNALKGVSKFGR